MVVSPNMSRPQNPNSFRLSGLFLARPQKFLGRLGIDTNVVIPQRWKDVARRSFDLQVFRGADRHVTIDAILSEARTKLITHTTLLLLVALHASIGKKLYLVTFIPMGIMAFDTSHL